ncbi:MAG: flagellar hook-basal body protein [Candidatus Marinimicrobia bacterium]|nr:flagellar hook-basal body protein [Candidatus Neomarinimicrobiota bacterium]
MNIRFSELKQAMIGQLDRNSVVANNLANVNSNGYKRDVMFSELMGSNQKTDLVNHVATDFAQGDLSQTNNPLDLAISGEGYFTIDDGDQFVYTRDGHFTKGADGFLRTSSGQAVMGQAGWIDLGLGADTVGEVRIGMKGDVFVNDEFVDTLEISSFENQADIKKIGANLFRAQSGAIDNRVEEPMILQGKIEGSNVHAVHEMVALIELQRSFETSQKALKTLDSAIGKAASSIGNYK